jgi:ERCC4-related helicase
LRQNLQQDATALIGILQLAGNWNPSSDAKLGALVELLQQQHPTDKVLIFTQFADTARYLVTALQAQGNRRTKFSAIRFCLRRGWSG